mmetsp:Transcript_55460/g.152832  ORF Transcript_55460/g.152832 Transcript_55460/m.152832 type:complete len:260 (-) Transcript_55460:556-1335(-)
MRFVPARSWRCTCRFSLRIELVVRTPRCRFVTMTSFQSCRSGLSLISWSRGVVPSWRRASCESCGNTSLTFLRLVATSPLPQERSRYLLSLRRCGPTIATGPLWPHSRISSRQQSGSSPLQQRCHCARKRRPSCGVCRSLSSVVGRMAWLRWQTLWRSFGSVFASSTPPHSSFCLKQLALFCTANRCSWRSYLRINSSSSRCRPLRCGSLEHFRWHLGCSSSVWRRQGLAWRLPPQQPQPLSMQLHSLFSRSSSSQGAF